MSGKNVSVVTINFIKQQLAALVKFIAQVAPKGGT
jgi:hypothetical protein